MMKMLFTLDNRMGKKKIKILLRVTLLRAYNSKFINKIKK